MKDLLFVGAGGFFGASLRYLSVHGSLVLFPSTRLPLGTLFVNVLGCLLIGCMAGFIERSSTSADLRLFIVPGLLGGFTTFSAFSLESVNLLREGALGLALLNVVLSLVLCVGGTYVGLRVVGI